MNSKIGSTKTVKGGVNGRALARTIGRGMIWAILGLVLVRGVGAMLSAGRGEPETSRAGAPSVDQGVNAFAIRFARAYLANPSTNALAPYLAEGTGVGTGLRPRAGAGEVAQAEVSGTEDLGGGELVLTVACELLDSRTLYLAVPIVRSDAGEVAALGAPSIVAGPGTAVGVGRNRPQPLAGSGAPGIESLVSKFLPTYLAASNSEDLSYLLLPGQVVQPLGGQLALKALGGVHQLGDGEGPRRTVLAGVRVSDPTGGATYPLVYRLSVERAGSGDRWYVAAVEGVSA